MKTEIAGGILIAYLIIGLFQTGIWLLKQDDFEWIALADKIIGLLLISISLAIGFMIITAN